MIIEKINETKGWFFEEKKKTGKNDKPLADKDRPLADREREKYNLPTEMKQELSYRPYRYQKDNKKYYEHT